MAKKTKQPTPAIDSSLKIEQVSITDITPYEKNARVISEKAVASVAESIRQFGFRQPIVVDENNVIIMGHTRLRAAKSLGLTTVPVHVVSGLSPEKVRALRLADNKVAQETSWDLDILKVELGELADIIGDGDDLGKLTGFDSDELAELAIEDDQSETIVNVQEDNSPKEKVQKEKGRTKMLHCCPKCGHEWTGGDDAPVSTKPSKSAIMSKFARPDDEDE